MSDFDVKVESIMLDELIGPADRGQYLGQRNSEHTPAADDEIQYFIVENQGDAEVEHAEAFAQQIFPAPRRRILKAGEGFAAKVARPDFSGRGQFKHYLHRNILA